jgi:hypothetical protein
MKTWRAAMAVHFKAKSQRFEVMDKKNNATQK